MATPCRWCGEFLGCNVTCPKFVGDRALIHECDRLETEVFKLRGKLAQARGHVVHDRDCPCGLCAALAEV
jgi:hypothetical protein